MEWLGVDVGWVYPAADSDGNIYRWTRRRRPLEPVTKAGPVTIRRPDGRVQVREAYSPADAAWAVAIGQRDASRNIAVLVVSHARRTQRGIALEQWESFSRRKRAWVEAWKAIAYEAERRKVSVTQVDRAYTSITCPECDHKDRANRPTRDRFRCVKCGREGQADIIAALNIARKAAGLFGVDGGRCAHCEDRGVWRAGLCRYCYEFRRRRGHLPSETDIEVRRQEDDHGRFRARRRKEMLAEQRRRWDQQAGEKMRRVNEMFVPDLAERLKEQERWEARVLAEAAADDAAARDARQRTYKTVS